MMINWIFSIRWIINSVLSAILGYKIVWLALTFNQAPQIYSVDSSVISPTTVTQQPVTTGVAYNLDTLLKAQLFGNSQEKTPAKPPRENTAPKTKLNLKLQGIYYSTNPTASIALIAEEAKETKLYRIGDTLSDGGTLYQIHPKKVILLRNEQQETLPLVENKNVAEQKLSLTEAHTMPTTVVNSSTQSPEQLLGEYQQQLRTNPQKLRRLLNVTPYSQDGQFIGYQLRAGQDPNLLATFNLQAGDILTEVNGIAFDSPLKGLEIVQQLATAQQVNATVLRNGQPVSLSFVIGN